jgi:hypothetical protein
MREQTSELRRDERYFAMTMRSEKKAQPLELIAEEGFMGHHRDLAIRI